MPARRWTPAAGTRWSAPQHTPNGQVDSLVPVASKVAKYAKEKKKNSPRADSGSLLHQSTQAPRVSEASAQTNGVSNLELLALYSLCSEAVEGLDAQMLRWSGSRRFA